MQPHSNDQAMYRWNVAGVAFNPKVMIIYSHPPNPVTDVIITCYLHVSRLGRKSSTGRTDMT